MGQTFQKSEDTDRHSERHRQTFKKTDTQNDRLKMQIFSL